jgi:phosphoenolpyruvate carboxylase
MDIRARPPARPPPATAAPPTPHSEARSARPEPRCLRPKPAPRRSAPSPSPPNPAPAKPGAEAAPSADAPLIEDIRLLGRILGDVIREQEGAASYDLVERVRQLSVAFRLKSEARAGRDLDRLLTRLTEDETLDVIRAFSYFSHLANLAEDRHQLRLGREQEREGRALEGSLAAALQRLADHGIGSEAHRHDAAAAWISPVLTAHPTEVQRRSILDAQRAIADGLEARSRCSGARELERNDAELRARVTQLWQTRVLRATKLTVVDEIDNALSYYRSTFLEQVPRLYRELEASLPGVTVPPFFRMGSWIGGDRDGNPFVTADTLRAAFAHQSQTALRHYLTEVHALGAELSVSTTLSSVTADVEALAERSGDAGAHRADEPYRRALVGLYARLAATLRHLTGTEALRHAVAPRDPYGSAAEFLGDLRLIEASLRTHHGQALTQPRLVPLIRAVEVFGFHLATWTCARAPTSTRPSSPTCCRWRRSKPTTRARRSRALRAAAAPPRRAATAAPSRLCDRRRL